jgi:hypothetical protein
MATFIKGAAFLAGTSVFVDGYVVDAVRGEFTRAKKDGCEFLIRDGGDDWHLHEILPGGKLKIEERPVVVPKL